MKAGVKLAMTRMWTQSANSLPLLPFALFFFKPLCCIEAGLPRIGERKWIDLATHEQRCHVWEYIAKLTMVIRSIYVFPFRRITAQFYVKLNYRGSSQVARHQI